MKPSLTYKEPAGLSQHIASPRVKESDRADGPGDDAWGGRDPAHISSIWIGSCTMKTFLPLPWWRGERLSWCVWCARRRHLISQVREVLSSVGDSEMIGKVEKEESRKQRSYSLMEVYFIRLIRNMCFPQTGKPSWKTSSHKGFGWKQAPPGTRWGGGGSGRRPCSWLGSWQGTWEESATGRPFSCGRFPGEVPFQELKILNNVQNFEKSKRLWTILSGNSTALKETRWLATTNPDPGKT